MWSNSQPISVEIRYAATWIRRLGVRIPPGALPDLLYCSRSGSASVCLQDRIPTIVPTTSPPLLGRARPAHPKGSPAGVGGSAGLQGPVRRSDRGSVGRRRQLGRRSYCWTWDMFEVPGRCVSADPMCGKYGSRWAQIQSAAVLGCGRSRSMVTRRWREQRRRDGPLRPA